MQELVLSKQDIEQRFKLNNVLNISRKKYFTIYREYNLFFGMNKMKMLDRLSVYCGNATYNFCNYYLTYNYKTYGNQYEFQNKLIEISNIEFSLIENKKFIESTMFDQNLCFKKYKINLDNLEGLFNKYLLL